MSDGFARARSYFCFGIFAAIGLSASLGAHPVQAAGPDLSVESVKLFTNAEGVVNDRVIVYKVTNVGTADAEPPFATMDFVSSERTEKLGVPALKAGASFDGFVSLSSACDGVTVTVMVQGVGDSNLVNNSLGPVKICDALPPPPPAAEDDDFVVYGGCDCRPAEAMPGTHEVYLKPSAYRGIERISRRSVPSRDRYSINLTNTLPQEVGWYGGEYVSEGRFMRYQAAADFDLAPIINVPNAVVTHAHISFWEFESRWLDEHNMKLPTYDGCVSGIGAAMANWGGPVESFTTDDMLFRDRPISRSFLPNPVKRTESHGVRQIFRAIDITEHVRQRVAAPMDPSLWYGYILHSAEDTENTVFRSSCLSVIDNVSLVVTYSVP